MAESRNSNLPIPTEGPLRIKTNQALAIRSSPSDSAYSNRNCRKYGGAIKRRHDVRYRIYGSQGGITGKAMCFCTKEQKRTKHLVSGASEKLGAVEIHRSHAFEGIAEISKPLALPIPFWDWKRTMPALKIEFNRATFDCHEYIIKGNISE